MALPRGLTLGHRVRYRDCCTRSGRFTRIVRITTSCLLTTPACRDSIWTILFYFIRLRRRPDCNTRSRFAARTITWPRSSFSTRSMARPPISLALGCCSPPFSHAVLPVKGASSPAAHRYDRQGPQRSHRVVRLYSSCQRAALRYEPVDQWDAHV